MISLALRRQRAFLEQRVRDWLTAHEHRLHLGYFHHVGSGDYELLLGNLDLKNRALEV